MVKKSAKNFHVKVAVRVRPLLGHDRRQQAAVEIDTARGEVLVLDPEKLFPGRKQEIDYLRADKSRDRCYNFDYVFDGHTTNDDVFDRACAPQTWREELEARELHDRAFGIVEPSRRNGKFANLPRAANALSQLCVRCCRSIMEHHN